MISVIVQANRRRGKPIEVWEGGRRWSMSQVTYTLGLVRISTLGGATHQLDWPGPDLLESHLDTGPHQPQHGVQDLQQGRRLEDPESEAGALVQAGDTLAGRQVAARLVEEVTPAQGLDGVVGHQVEFAHRALRWNVELELLTDSCTDWLTGQNVKVEAWHGLGLCTLSLSLSLSGSQHCYYQHSTLHRW